MKKDRAGRDIGHLMKCSIDLHIRGERPHDVLRCWLFGMGSAPAFIRAGRPFMAEWIAYEARRRYRPVGRSADASKEGKP